MSRRAGAACAALLLAAAGLLLAGCGNAKHDFRDHKLNPLTQALATERATLAQALRLARPHRRRDAVVLRGQLAQIAATTRQIARLKPPGGTETQFLGYTRANAALVAALSRYIDAFAGGTTAQQDAAAQGTQTAAGTADGAETKLRDVLR